MSRVHRLGARKARRHVTQIFQFGLVLLSAPPSSLAINSLLLSIFTFLTLSLIYQPRLDDSRRWFIHLFSIIPAFHSTLKQKNNKESQLIQVMELSLCKFKVN